MSLGFLYGRELRSRRAGFVAGPQFDQRTLDVVSLMDQTAAARP